MLRYGFCMEVKSRFVVYTWRKLIQSKINNAYMYTDLDMSKRLFLISYSITWGMRLVWIKNIPYNTHTMLLFLLCCGYIIGADLLTHILRDCFIGSGVVVWPYWEECIFQKMDWRPSVFMCRTKCLWSTLPIHLKNDSTWCSPGPLFTKRMDVLP